MKKVLILALALILLLGIAARGTFGLFSDTETSSGNTFTAWVEVCDCYKFNVVDKSDAKIYKYNDSGTPVGSFDLSEDSGFPVGVATVGGDIYVIDHPDHKAYKYDCCGNLLDVSKVLRSVSGSGIGNPDGIAIYDTQMWVVSGNDKNIYRYSLDDAFPDDGSSLPADFEIGLDDKTARGLTINGTHIYIVAYSTSAKETTFYRYLHDGDSAKVSRVLLEYTSDNKLQSPAGAMFDGTSLWVVDSGTNKMYRYDNITNLFLDDGNPVNANWEFPLHPDNTDATGV